MKAENNAACCFGCNDGIPSKQKALSSSAPMILVKGKVGRCRTYFFNKKPPGNWGLFLCPKLSVTYFPLARGRAGKRAAFRTST